MRRASPNNLNWSDGLFTKSRFYGNSLQISVDAKGRFSTDIESRTLVWQKAFNRSIKGSQQAHLLMPPAQMVVKHSYL